MFKWKCEVDEVTQVILLFKFSIFKDRFSSSCRADVCVSFTSFNAIAFPYSFWKKIVSFSVWNSKYEF